VQEVLRMMEMTTQAGGTAPRAQVPGYRVGRQDRHGAQARAGGYAEHKYVSSFVGFGPVSDPRFIVAVMLDEPAGAKYFGGDIGAPVFSSVMGAALRMMAVPPDSKFEGSEPNFGNQRAQAKAGAHGLGSDPG
jgi:cell division protein FtsI (penicillin-binding protein 3)